MAQGKQGKKVAGADSSTEFRYTPAMINKSIAHYKITSKLGLRPESVLSLTEAQRHRENRGEATCLGVSVTP